MAASGDFLPARDQPGQSIAEANTFCRPTSSTIRNPASVPVMVSFLLSGHGAGCGVEFGAYMGPNMAAFVIGGQQSDRDGRFSSTPVIIPDYQSFLRLLLLVVVDLAELTFDGRVIVRGGAVVCGAIAAERIATHVAGLALGALLGGRRFVHRGRGLLQRGHEVFVRRLETLDVLAIVLEDVLDRRDLRIEFGLALGRNLVAVVLKRLLG